MARPAKDDVAKKRPTSFAIDEDNLLLWELLECTRSYFVAAMLQHVVKDEKLRDIFYGSNGASALKAFELIEQRKERKRQEFLEKASGGTYGLEQTVKKSEAIDEPESKDIAEDKKVEAIDELNGKNIEDNKNSETLPIKKLKKSKDKIAFD